MIYEVYLDDKLLYYPNDETYVILNSKLELSLNEAGSFEFDIPSYNLRYEDFKPRKSMIKVLQNNVEIFYGEVREITQSFDFTKHIYAVGELAFLFDSIQPQAVYQTSPYEMLKQVLAQHNSQVEDRKKYELGEVIIADDYTYHFTNREDTLTVLRDKICKTYGVYLKIVKVDGKRQLSFVPLANYGVYCRQEIQFGENLLDYSCNKNASDIATRVIPLGARLEDDERTTDAIQGLDEYVTIKGTVTNDYHKKASDDFVSINEAVATFGNVTVVKNWDDVTQPSNLQEKAIEWLKSAQYEDMILELKALDKNLVDANIDSFDIGDTIHVWALPYDMDTTLPVRKKTIYINDLKNNTVSLGNTVKTSYTKQASDAVNSVEDSIPEVSPILESARLKSMTLLNNPEGGHVIAHFDETESYIEELIICDGDTEKHSTQKWVWNLKGFGFMYRDSVNEDWKDISVAITMDGEIVADFITTGTMLANRIKGGVLALGGSDQGKYANGEIQIYNASDQLVGKWNRNGIDIDSGDINLGNGVFHVDDKGNLTCSSAEITSGLLKQGDNKDRYINFSPSKDSGYEDYINFTGKGWCVRLDSAKRFLLDRFVLCVGANEDGDPNRIQFDTANLVKYSGGKVENQCSWGDLVKAYSTASTAKSTADSANSSIASLQSQINDLKSSVDAGSTAIQSAYSYAVSANVTAKAINDTLNENQTVAKANFAYSKVLRM